MVKVDQRFRNLLCVYRQMSTINWHQDLLTVGIRSTIDAWEELGRGGPQSKKAMGDFENCIPCFRRERLHPISFWKHKP